MNDNDCEASGQNPLDVNVCEMKMNVFVFDPQMLEIYTSI